MNVTAPGFLFGDLSSYPAAESMVVTAGRPGGRPGRAGGYGQRYDSDGKTGGTPSAGVDDALNWLTVDEITRLYGRPAGSVYRLASTEHWRRCDNKRPTLYKASDVEETFDRLNASGRR